MPPAAAGSLTGNRIRERRLDRGLRQADLARDVGISPSYLNLIEHNRRRIGGKLLRDIAAVLGVEPQMLAEGAEAAVIDGLRAAAARIGSETAEQARAEDFAGRFPGWAGLVVAQDRRIAALETRVEILQDRMAHDPALAAALHEIISTVTSIRASSAILVGEDGLDADWQRRFQRNIDDDARRLSDGSAALVSFLKASDAAEAGAGSRTYLVPDEEVAAFLREAVPGLSAEIGAGLPPPAEEGGGTGGAADPVAAAVEARLAGGDVLRSRSGRALAAFHLRRTAADAVAMPTEALLAALQDTDWDPAAVARGFGADLPAVLRRIASLPPKLSGRPAGLAICDAAGTFLVVQPVAGFDMPRTSPACPRWPLFRALTAPGQPIREEITLPGTAAGRFLCYAVAAPRGVPDFGAVPVIESTMLVLPFQSGGAAAQDAPAYGCPVCRQPDCTAGREPFVSGA